MKFSKNITYLYWELIPNVRTIDLSFQKGIETEKETNFKKYAMKNTAGSWWFFHRESIEFDTHGVCESIGLPHLIFRETAGGKPQHNICTWRSNVYNYVSFLFQYFDVEMKWKYSKKSRNFFE